MKHKRLRNMMRIGMKRMKAEMRQQVHHLQHRPKKLSPKTQVRRPLARRLEGQIDNNVKDGLGLALVPATLAQILDYL